jgi:hypothetical protein
MLIALMSHQPLHKLHLLVGYGSVRIEKMSAEFFERSKSSSVAMTLPAGGGGDSIEFFYRFLQSIPD